MIFGPIYHCLSARFCGLTLYSPHRASTAAVKQSWALVWQSGSHDVNVSIGAKDWWHPTTRHNSDFSSLHVVNTQNSFVYRWEGLTSIIFRNFHNTNKASKQNFSHVTRKYIALTKNWTNFTSPKNLCNSPFKNGQSCRNFMGHLTLTWKILRTFYSLGVCTHCHPQAF